MSVDRLQDKIRKMKNPTVLQFVVGQEQIPEYIMAEEGSFLSAYSRFCMELLDLLRDFVPAVRFSFNGFAILGSDGLGMLSKLLSYASKLGYYVILDAPEALTAQQAQENAMVFMASQSQWPADGLVITNYIGTDAVRPYAALLNDAKKALFVVVRTGNKSAAELQDLLTGSRLAHVAQADMVNRLAENHLGRSGYYGLGVVSAATSSDSMNILRNKYNRLFMLVDGFDNTGANAKNCSYAFDKLGHGAGICVGTSITGAWRDEEYDSSDYLQSAYDAAQRIKKNLCRYTTIL